MHAPVTKAVGTRILWPTGVTHKANAKEHVCMDTLFNYMYMYITWYTCSWLHATHATQWFWLFVHLTGELTPLDYSLVVEMSCISEVSAGGCTPLGLVPETLLASRVVPPV